MPNVFQLLTFALALTSSSVLAQVDQLSAPTALPTNYTLSHRFLSSSSHSSSSSSTFLPRGLISISSSPLSVKYFVDSQSIPDSEYDNNVESGWYQLALSLDGNSIEEDQLIASTKSCFVSPSDPTRITLYLSSDYVPTSLRIDTPGTCLPDSSSSTSTSFNFPSTPVIITLYKPSHVESPTLLEPASIDAMTGQVVTPPPEKTFLQKYWLAILGVVLFMVTQMGPDDSRGGRGGAN